MTIEEQAVVLAQLKTIKRRLARDDGLLEQRVSLWKRGRALGIPSSELGAASGVSGSAVRQATR